MTTEREKIINLARECGADEKYYGMSMTEGMVFYNHEQLEAFYKLAQAEAFESIAKWYQEKGWLLDESDVPDAIRERAKGIK